MALIDELLQQCKKQQPFTIDNCNEVDADFLTKLEALSLYTKIDDDFAFLGQNLIGRIVANYPHITPQVNRDLFWFFGGDCLHYMTDDEIQNYQKLDELLYVKEHSKEDIDFNHLKAIAFNMH